MLWDRSLHVVKVAWQTYRPERRICFKIMTAFACQSCTALAAVYGHSLLLLLNPNYREGCADSRSTIYGPLPCEILCIYC